ncbi:MAG: hypothetical protein ACD_11C00063G0001 [uncultured bacterium]|nr:MAG: hypothetical protein ACD_11C00063G0001 [uncultured bacterium]
MTNGLVSELPAGIIQEKIYTYSQNDFGFSQKLRLFRFLLFNASKFDIIHLLFTPTKSNIFFINLALAISGARRKTRTIQTVATLREDIFSNQEIKKLMFSDLVITYSDYAKNKLEKLGIANTKRIYPGIDLDIYKPAPKDPEVLSKFNIQASEFVISYPGEYVRLGATDGLVEILPKLFEKIPNAKFIFACRIKNEKDAKKKNEVIEKLREHNLLEKVAFSDTFADVSKLYNLADVVVFPVGNMKGKFDVPLAVIEAMACEKPVVISDIPILQEFATAENSAIIKNGDFSQLIDVLMGLSADQESRKALGKSARKYVEMNFDIKNVSEEYKKAYESLN